MAKMFISLTERMSCYEELQIPVLLPHFKELRLPDIKPGLKTWIEELKTQKPQRPRDELPAKTTALRYLFQKLRRDAIDVTNKLEIIEYLKTLNISEDCCSEIADIMLDKSSFEEIPKTLHLLLPTITSMSHKIDFTLCDKDPENEVRVLLLLELSDGSRRSLFVSKAGLSNLLALCCSVRRKADHLQVSVDDYSEELKLKQAQ